ncbi:MAG: BCCT family transporter [Halothiobacillaceae bacterium]
MNPRVTLAAMLIVISAVFLAGLHTEATGRSLASLRLWLTPFLEWFYVALVAFLLLFMIWLGNGRYKNVRLGGDHERPQFTFFSWVAMLFAAGTGIGILFWSVAQPILQFQSNPFVDEGLTPEAATIAMRLTYFHWGLNGWAIFGFVGLVLGYFAYRHNLPLTIRSALTPLLGDRVRGLAGDLVDTLAVFGTVFGIATTLGLGVQQLNAGLYQVFGLSPSVPLQLLVIASIMTVAVISVVSGVQRGVRMLSELNFWLSIAALAFMLLFGPTQYLIGLTIEATGDYMQNLLAMTFHTNVTRGSDWQAEWTVFFWGWWLAWSPFVGMFIARISRGRTFREFVLGVLLAPTLITVVWIGVFGGTALYHELFGGGGVVDAVAVDVSMALFATIEGMQIGAFTPVVGSLLILLIATFLVTSANAGTLVINTILSGGDADPPSLHRIVWGVVLAVLTAVLLIAGGLEVLQAAVIAAALPFSLVVIAMIAGLLRALADERFAAREGVMTTKPAEPWAVSDHTNAGGSVSAQAETTDGLSEAPIDPRMAAEHPARLDAEEPVAAPGGESQSAPAAGSERS